MHLFVSGPSNTNQFISRGSWNEFDLFYFSLIIFDENFLKNKMSIIHSIPPMTHHYHVEKNKLVIDNKYLEIFDSPDSVNFIHPKQFLGCNRLQFVRINKSSETFW
jgi:hypothetical protein